MNPLAVTVNGQRHELHDDAASVLLVDWLREQADLPGAHRGCDTAQCGACTVQVDGDPVKACSLLTLQVAGSQVVTVEGLANADGTLHPLQRAFVAHRAAQCGYCTPGMLMAGAAMLAAAEPALDDAQVRRRLEGNLCRCTGYQPIVDAILSCVSRAP